MTVIEITKQQFAEVIPGTSVALFGQRYQKEFNVEFKIGDQAVYDSWNLIYLGVIEKISNKTVTVRDKFKRVHRMKLQNFLDRNWNFDLAKIRKQNEETSWTI